MYKFYCNKQLIYSSDNREEYKKLKEVFIRSSWNKQIFGYNFDKI